jgi:hypothetical protein
LEEIDMINTLKNFLIKRDNGGLLEFVSLFTGQVIFIKYNINQQNLIIITAFMVIGIKKQGLKNHHSIKLSIN